jgi:MoaA/NifB/PqqE/SkfB family radical SAM enzyme
MHRRAEEIAPNCGTQERLCIEATTRCNSSCLHCFNRVRSKESPDLSYETAKKVLREGYLAGYRELHITGGEPLMWAGFLDLLDDGYRIGFQKISVNTNGTLLTHRLASKLAGYEALTLSISLDGPEAIHDHLRGKGSYRRALRGVENALDQNIDLSIFCVARKSLLSALPRFADGLYKSFPGIDHLTLIQLIRVGGVRWHMTDDLLSPTDFVTLVKTVALLNLYGLEVRIKCNPLANIAARLLGIPWIPMEQPLHRHGSMFITANGDIRLSHSSRIRLGKYEPGVIQNLLFSEKYQSALAPNYNTCFSCNFAELCRDCDLKSPPEHFSNEKSSVPYCKRVLDIVYNENRSSRSGSEQKKHQPMRA